MRSRQRKRAAVAFLAAGVLAVAALVLAGAVCGMRQRAATCEPAPVGTGALSAAAFLTEVFRLYGAETDAGGGERVDENGFPLVDWDYWRQVNPNVVGWVTVPGTNVNGPIVLAPANDPDYYLKHDVYGEPNLYGCLYLDASCAAAGLLGSRNAVVYGHNMSLMDGSMFTALARYANAAYAADHAEMLVQTPDEKKACPVLFASVVDASAETTRTQFENDADFDAWYGEQAAKASVTLRGEVPESVVTFCTCSYSRWSNERTLVYVAK